MGEEAAGRRIEVFVEKEFVTGGPPLLPLNLLPRHLVIPNSDNHAFTGFDLVLHRLAEEGSHIVCRNFKTQNPANHYVCRIFYYKI
jgi:hypothetical protein